ncbi:MAG: hypothetical protein AABZ20_03880 [candidate division NC10 bacterium]
MLEHPWQNGLGEGEYADQVYLHQRPELRRRGGLQGRRQAAAGVVHQDVDPLPLTQHPLDYGPARCGVRHVGGADQRVAGQAANLVGDLLQPLLPAGQKRHAHAFPRQRLGRGRPDPARGARHQRHLPDQHRHAQRAIPCYR